MGIEEKAAALLEQASQPRPVRVNLQGKLFPQQLRFASSKHRFRVARTSRRAGKTVTAPAVLCDAAQRCPGSTALYVTRTRLRAKDLIWRPLLRWNDEQGLGAKPNESELQLRFANGSVVALAGANTREEIEKRRGDPFSVVVLDEAQSFPNFVKELVDEILAPGLMDFSGSLLLTGTPPRVPAGFFQDCCNSKGWELHEWTVWDNPFMAAKSGKTVRQLLDEELARKGVEESDPGIQREWFGRSVVDLRGLVFQYLASRNHFEQLPKLNNFVIGIDLGFVDADAIAVLGWADPGPKQLYLVEEVVVSKQHIRPLAQKLQQLHSIYSPLAMVLDAGGLGTKIESEFQMEYALPVKAAEKSRKFEFIELVNDALRSGRMFAKKDSRFAQDCLLVEWDFDHTTPDKKRINESQFHSDICDAVLYAYRESQHWLADAPKEEKSYLDSEREKMEAEFERQLDENRREQQENDLGWLG